MFFLFSVAFIHVVSLFLSLPLQSINLYFSVNLYFRRHVRLETIQFFEAASKSSSSSGTSSSSSSPAPPAPICTEIFVCVCGHSEASTVIKPGNIDYQQYKRPKHVYTIWVD